MSQQELFLLFAGARMNREERDRLKREYTPLVVKGIRSFYSSRYSTALTSRLEKAATWVFFKCLFDYDIPGVEEVDPWNVEAIPGYLETYLVKCDPLQYENELLPEAYEWMEEGSEKARLAILAGCYLEVVALGDKLVLKFTRKQSEICNRLSIDIIPIVMGLFERHSTPLRNYKAFGPVKAYLGGTLAYRILDAKEALISRPHFPLFESDGHVGAPLWVETDKRRLKRALHEGLMSLPTVPREAINRKYFGEGTQGEVAREVGVSDSTISRDKKKSFLFLREFLTSKGFDWNTVKALLDESGSYWLLKPHKGGSRTADRSDLADDR